MTELAVVVGASGALGSAVCERLTSRYRVLAIARDAQKLGALAATSGVTPLSADAGDDGFVQVVGEAIAGTGLQVGMSVFTAGLGIAGSVDAITPSAIAQAVNLKAGGTVRLLQAVTPHLAETSVFVSVAGSLGLEPGPMDATPGAANAALINLMKQISLLRGPRGLRVHTIAPGPLDSPRLRGFAERRAAEAGGTPEEMFDAYRAAASSGELPSIDDVAWLIATLAEPHAAALHGSLLSPDGGVRRGLT